jgi:hypothetical protein
VTALLGCVLGIGCGGASSPTAPTSAAPPPVQGLFLSTSSGRAERVFFPPRGEYSEIRYTWCYSINLARDVVNRSVTIRRVENTVLGPSGSVYSTSTSSFLTGNSFISTGSIGAFGCPDAYNDPDVARPVATTYRMQIDYVFDDGMPPGIFSAVAGGVIESRVPPPPTTPQMTALTITHDIPGPQLIIRNRTPATFTAIGEGGVPPYEFQWRINGFVLRDWNPNPTFTWDTNINGAPALPGGYTLTVYARSAGGRELEVSESLNFSVQG